MAKTRGMGLLMLWCRYVALRGGPKYLAKYELEDHHVLKTAAFLDEVRYRPSPWRQKTSGGH
jgi:hypothetical protein